MTVGELLSRISSKELTEWMIFYGYEPFGYEAQMLGHGVVASTLANIHRKKSSKSFAPSDFMPEFTGGEDIASVIGLVEEINKLTGGEDKRGS